MLTERLVRGAAMPCGTRSASQAWRSSRDALGRSFGFLRGARAHKPVHNSVLGSSRRQEPWTTPVQSYEGVDAS